jgi:hypothetical protein
MLKALGPACVFTAVEGQGRPSASGGGIEVESKAVRAVVDQVSASATNPAFPGHTTYRCSLQLMGDARNVYTIYGTEANPMNIPGAFQTPAPFGVNVGGVNPAFLAVPTCGVGEQAAGGQGHACARDSWLTVGLTEGDPSSMLSSIGIDWVSWTETHGVTVDNGAVFWMSPDDGPTSFDVDGKGPLNGNFRGQFGLMAGNIVVAQITLLETHQATLKLNAQGRTTARMSSNSAEGNWEELAIVFEMRQGGNAPATPPPPPSANACSELKMGLIKRCMEDCCECQSKMAQYNLIIADCVIPGGQPNAGKRGTQQMAFTCGTFGVQNSCPGGQSCNAGVGECQCNNGICAAPNICTAQGICVFQCVAGTEPIWPIGSNTCRNCEGNKYSPMGQTCETCAPGREPNADHTACQPCHDKGAQAWFSSDGGRCQMCSPGSEVDAGRTQCTVCTLPQQFSAHGLSCIPCANEGVATAGHTACVPGTTRPPPPPQQTGTFSGGGGRIEYVTENAVGKVDVYENNGLAGYTTYRLSLQLQRDAKNVYTIYGDTTSGSNHPMSFPPAYQVAAPFGANIGGVADQLIAVHADATYDSWLTVGVTGGNNAGAISSIDIDWSDWDENGGLTVGILAPSSPHILLACVLPSSTLGCDPQPFWPTVRQRRGLLDEPGQRADRGSGQPG